MAVIKKHDENGAYYQMEGDYKIFHLEEYGRERAKALALSRSAWLEGMPMYGQPWDEGNTILSQENEKIMNDVMGEVLTYNKDGYFIELNQLDGVSGRARIKMSAHAIYPNNNMWNGNGITWTKENTEANIDSAIGMAYVVNFLDKDRQEMPYDHGTMTFDEYGSVSFPDSDEVGSVQKAYIEELNGVETLMTEGYINSQRYPLFVKWLKRAIADGEVIHGSIEINGKNGSKIIEYKNGSRDSNGDLKTGRIPTVYDYTGLAILYFEEPSDRMSQILEVNSKSKEGKKEEDTMTIEQKYQEQLEANAKLTVENGTLKGEVKDLGVEINALKEKNVALGETVAEKDTLVLTAAETLKSTETELNSLKESHKETNDKLEVIEKAKAEAEVNSFVEESTKYLEEADVAVLKGMVETCSLNDIKIKRSELIEAKVVAGVNAKAEAETNKNNTNEDVIVNTVITDEKVVIDSKVTSLADID